MIRKNCIALSGAMDMESMTFFPESFIRCHQQSCTKIPAHFTFTSAVYEQTLKKMTILSLPVMLERLHSYLIYKMRVIVHRKHNNFI